MLQCWSADHESATPKTMETILDKGGFKATKHRFWNTFRGILPSLRTNAESFKFFEKLI